MKSEVKINSKIVEYKDGNEILEGYFVENSAKPTGSKVPTIIIIHDWMGVSDFTIDKAKKIVEEFGFNAFVADIYGKGIRPKNSKEASEQAGKYKGNVTLYRSRINAVLNELKSYGSTDQNNIAAIGYCFGGTGVLELARSGANVKGVVSFHGGLSTPDNSSSKNIKAKVLVLHGADDPFVNEDEVNNFGKEMKSAKIDYQLVKYSNSVHAFTNPKAGNDNSKGAAYNELSDKRSWKAMRIFFDELFNK